MSDVDQDTREAWVEIMRGLGFQRPGGFSSYLEMAQEIVKRYAAAPQSRSDGWNEDDRGVDRFALAMRKKLSIKRAEGKYGWDDPDVCSVADLQAMLNHHVTKGDPVDIANFCMMIWNRENHAAPSQECPVCKLVEPKECPLGRSHDNCILPGFESKATCSRCKEPADAASGCEDPICPAGYEQEEHDKNTAANRAEAKQGG